MSIQWWLAAWVIGVAVGVPTVLGLMWLGLKHRRTSFVLGKMLIAVLVTAIARGVFGLTIALVVGALGALAVAAIAVLEWRNPYETTERVDQPGLPGLH